MPSQKITIGGVQFDISALTIKQLKNVFDSFYQALTKLDLESGLDLSAVVQVVVNQGLGYLVEIWPMVFRNSEFKVSLEWLEDNITIPDLKNAIEIFIVVNGIPKDQIIPFVRSMVRVQTVPKTTTN